MRLILVFYLITGAERGPSCSAHLIQCYSGAGK